MHCCVCVCVHSRDRRRTVAGDGAAPAPLVYNACVRVSDVALAEALMAKDERPARTRSHAHVLTHVNMFPVHCPGAAAVDAVCVCVLRYRHHNHRRNDRLVRFYGAAQSMREDACLARATGP